MTADPDQTANKKVLVFLNGEEQEKELKLTPDQAQELDLELSGELLYITEFETTKGEIIGSDLIMCRLEE